MRRFVYGLRLIIRGITVPVLGIGPLIIAIIVLYNLYKFSSWSAIVLFVVCLFCIVFGISVTAYVGKCITDNVDKDHKSKCLFLTNEIS